MIREANVGSSFDDFLSEEGLLEDCEESALREILADRLRTAMSEQRLSPADMAARMKTSREALEHLLQPGAEDVSLQTMKERPPPSGGG